MKKTYNAMKHSKSGQRAKDENRTVEASPQASKKDYVVAVLKCIPTIGECLRAFRWGAKIVDYISKHGFDPLDVIFPN